MLATVPADLLGCRLSCAGRGARFFEGWAGKANEPAAKKAARHDRKNQRFREMQ
jgi:hypothetical protein